MSASASERLRELGTNATGAHRERWQGPVNGPQMELFAVAPELALWAADVADRLQPLRSHPLAAKALERLEEIVP